MVACALGLEVRKSTKQHRKEEAFLPKGFLFLFFMRLASLQRGQKNGNRFTTIPASLWQAHYLYLRFLAASDFFLRFTLGFS
jgi:hypothetical protein